MKTSEVFFIIGAEGVGKTSILGKLKKTFQKIDIHDFDEFIVPQNPTLKWRLDTTLLWIKKSIRNQNEKRTTIILGLCFPEELKAFKEFKKLKNVSFLLLDVNENEREKRLKKRGASKEVIEDTECLLELRRQIKKEGEKIIDTSTLSINKTFLEVNKFINEVIRG
jgi:broad-specificity NMP kinase